MNIVGEKIEAEIRMRGAIPFARFMELALYCPEYGYYEKENDNIGRRGDFFTSVSVGPLLGQLLAFQFADWLAELPPGPVQIVEAGAHDGRLAVDILDWLKHWRPEICERLEYRICESSERRRLWQRKTLVPYGEQVRWVDSEWKSPASPVNGVIFSNEFLDALPVHRVGWDASRRAWFEWGVIAEGSQFVWARLAHSAVLLSASGGGRRLAELPEALLDVLPNNYTAELCPAAENWWGNAAGALQQGRLVTLDYGMRAEEVLTPQRAGGTLRSYYRHKHCEDVLANAGEQDITAHVDFSSIQQAGESAGLKTETFGSQSDFLTGIMKRFWTESEPAGDWTSRQAREFQTLIHPDQLGRAFRVLSQRR